MSVVVAGPGRFIVIVVFVYSYARLWFWRLARIAYDNLGVTGVRM